MTAWLRGQGYGVNPKRVRRLMRLNVLEGSGRNSDVPGFFVGGKTGTSEKVIDGEYSGDHRLNTFLAAFPVHAPRYLVLVVIDEPQVEEGEVYATAGMNAAPVTREIISRSALLLGVPPNFGADELAMNLDGTDDANDEASDATE